MIKIYTKTGDKGQTSLFGGKKVSKASLRTEAIGSVDELNSVIGFAVTEIKNAKLKNELLKIQHDLFAIGSALASPNTKYKRQNTKYLESRITGLEILIDLLTEKLPELQNFILPGGGKAGASLHLTRSICRRAERRVVLLTKEKVAPEIIIYLNRLSDLLFTMARFVNYQERKKEIIWIKKQ